MTKVPAAHKSHADWPRTGLREPGGQDSQVSCPKPAWNLPSGQRKQSGNRVVTMEVPVALVLLPPPKPKPVGTAETLCTE